MLSVALSMASAMIAGISFSTSRRPNTVAVNRISKTRPVSQVVVSSEWKIFSNFSSL